MSIEDFYNTTAVVEKQVTGSTGMGGVKKNFTTRIPSLLCRITSK